MQSLGHKEVADGSALQGTAHELLDYFDLKPLIKLPRLAEARNFDH
ncbi:MAG: hypothetical protein LJE92_09490 [Gammaproteobacteria bacterium]|jgi:chromosome segregation and condensation protein ScpB|nr:hypothetical protein [Gammaproteobacteria bacterium]